MAHTGNCDKIALNDNKSNPVLPKPPKRIFVFSSLIFTSWQIVLVLGLFIFGIVPLDAFKKIFLNILPLVICAVTFERRFRRNAAGRRKCRSRNEQIGQTYPNYKRQYE